MNIKVSKVKDVINLEEAAWDFKPGQQYCAAVLAVRESGVNVCMPGGVGSGMVGAKCWGTGTDRAHALSLLTVGDRINVTVKSFDKFSKVLTLVLSDCKHIPSVGATEKNPDAELDSQALTKGNPCVAKSHNTHNKPAYQLLPKGSTLIFDTANLIGQIGCEHAAHRLSTIATAISDQGYKSLFFWEHRAFDWTRHNQANEEEETAMKEFSRRDDVSMVTEESDLAVLQTAQVIPDSVVVSQDRFRDYAVVYPHIVNTSRQRSFSSFMLNDQTILSIYGLKDAIVIPSFAEPQDEEISKDEDEDCVNEINEGHVREACHPPVIKPSRGGLLGLADHCLASGAGARAIAILGKVARKQPKYYREIADAFESGNGICADAKLASRYDRLADRREKALRQRRRRACRLRAERRRGNDDIWPRAA